MKTWDYVWLTWLLAFLVAEGIALVDKDPGDTLSEHVWRWFKVRTVKATRIQWQTANNGEEAWQEAVGERRTASGWVFLLARLALLAFMVWLTMHLAFGWWGGGMFPIITFTAWAW
ncbi:MAG: hypothetical protein A2135_08650 [Actinobacteria bacterium RBG_16_67_15]|nr:MAG: hypothetical protein A2135_08650 [Actinobacteria bacterium RBG_16_67_15]